MTMAVHLPVIRDDVFKRPKTVGDCENGIRPCPHVRCEHNLLIDVMEDGSLVLNYPSTRLSGAERVFPDRHSIDRQWYVEVRLPEADHERSMAAGKARDEKLAARMAERTAEIRATAERKATTVIDEARLRSDRLPKGKTPRTRDRRRARVAEIMGRAQFRARELREQASNRAQEIAIEMASAVERREQLRVFVLGPFDSATRANEVTVLWTAEHGTGTAVVHRDWPDDLERAGLVERDIDASFRDELEDAIEHWFAPGGEPVASCLLDEIKTIDRSQLDCLLDGIAQRMFVSRERVRQVLGSGVNKVIAASPDTAIEEDIDMADKTAIAWCEHTHNLWIGCEHAPSDAPESRALDDDATPTSPECDNCYAERFDRRYGGEHWGSDAPRRLLSDEYWRKPLRWNAAAEKAGQRARVFCSSMADWAEMLGGERGRLLDEQRARLWELIPRTPWLDWLLLTKRIENTPKLLPWYRDGSEPWPNVWVGTTCGARSSLWRVHRLREISAVVRFVSAEPLLDHISHDEWDEVLGLGACEQTFWNAIDWLIVGDESGPGRRPAQADWVRTARDAAERHGVAFVLKQWNGPVGNNVGITGTREGGKRTIHLPILDGKRHDARPR